MNSFRYLLLLKDDKHAEINNTDDNIERYSNGENKNEMIISNFQQQNTDQANLNSELKNTNNSLLSKLVRYFILLYTYNKGQLTLEP